MGCVCVCVCMYEVIYFKELTHGIVGLASLKSVRQAHRLEVQVRTDVANLSPKCIGRASWLETQGGFCVAVLEQNCFSGKSFLLLSLSTD